MDVVEEMKKHLLQEPLPDLEIIDETSFTWEIDGWRSMERKVHGPIFDCGGHPWSVPWWKRYEEFIADVELIGKSCSSLMETAFNVPPYTSSTGLMRPTRHQKDGIAVCSSAWFFGTHGNQRITTLIVRTSITK